VRWCSPSSPAPPPSLPEAFLVNPHDVDGLKEAFVAALNMPAAERSEPMRRMRHHVCAHDVTRWATEYLEALGETDLP
jgi:trehalose 6-phosphate synthase